MVVNLFKKYFKIVIVLLFIITIITLCCQYVKFDNLTVQTEFFAKRDAKYYDTVDDVPNFDGEPFVIINNNVPNFNKKDLVEKSFEEFSAFDEHGRSGTAFACIGTDIMPTEERKSTKKAEVIGWVYVKNITYDGVKLFNKCHLIGYQLTGENSNSRNMIAGTRYFNNQGMLPFENMVAEYVKSSENHVLYRVTPVFIDDNFLAKGVQIEAMSIEDNGEDICFNVFVYNAYPGIVINYETGEITEKQ